MDKELLNSLRLQLDYLIGLRLSVNADYKKFLRALDDFIDQKLTELYEVLDNAKTNGPSVS